MALFKLIPQVYTFREYDDFLGKFVYDRYCFDEYGMAGVKFSFTERTTQPVVAGGSYTWKQMNLIPPGIGDNNESKLVIDTTCSAVDLSITIKGLIETADPGFEQLELYIGETAQTFPLVYHKSKNCGETHTQENVNIIESIDWRGLGLEDCSERGDEDKGDEILAELPLTLSQSTCPTILEFRTSTQDGDNHCGGNIFYEITVTKNL
tara:strand:+ start:1986 stop:2609 length:624 start_codon:yes stop_codon:yes gene_type:complete